MPFLRVAEFETGIMANERAQINFIGGSRADIFCTQVYIVVLFAYCIFMGRCSTIGQRWNRIICFANPNVRAVGMPPTGWHCARVAQIIANNDIAA